MRRAKHVVMTVWVWLLSGCALGAAGRGGTGLIEGESVDATSDSTSLDPERAIVRGRVIEGFKRLSDGDPSYVLAMMPDDVEYTFEGRHALGGTRVTKAGVEKWFARLLRLIPGRFTLRSVEVTGGPWASVVYTVFEDQVQPLVGPAYRNHGVQIVELRWGQAVRIHTYVDTALVDAALNLMLKAGVEEAGAAPITE